jgi:hypothetical protein
MRGKPSSSEGTGNKGIRRPVADHIIHVIAIDVDQVRVAALNTVDFDGLGNPLQNLVVGIDIVRIENTDDISTGQRYAFVHGVVQALIRFTDDSVQKRDVRIQNIPGVVRGIPVYDNVLDIGVGL